MLNISYKELVKSVQEMMTAINERVTLCKDEDMKEISKKDEQGVIQCSNLHKKVQKYLEYIDKGIKWNEEIKEMIHVWWNQPAQFISVSVKIDDRLLCHWLRLWSFTMHKLNKNK
ncbi:uncharacterized protein LOC111631927 [Centruroides sculpturatus]|uniref:uncharacterized protein LOC111631927 n=1 Tax=Centruroides sculpturatus TaxID=218467 RepID=UPI000C6E823A|nr:uncharacterized protein LOC111631927 [Centruroides sculpturatus]